MLVYVEFISRRPGVSLDTFHTLLKSSQDDWAAEQTDDVIVAKLGRTYRLGPDPEYLYAWWVPRHGLERLDEWESAFASAGDTIGASIEAIGRIDRAGCYDPLEEPIVATSERYYLERLDFAPGATREDVRALYAERRAKHPELTLNLLIDRIGGLAPDPRCLALWSLPSWGDLEGVARDLEDIDHPVRLVTASTYSVIGKETI